MVLWLKLSFFPISVLGATWMLVWITLRALHPNTPAAEVVGLMLVSTMLALAILEHFLLVLPLPSTALWRWALRSRTTQAVASATD